MAKKEHKIILGLDARQFRTQMEHVQGSFTKLQRGVQAFAGLWAVQVGAKMLTDAAELSVKVKNVESAFTNLNRAGLLEELQTATHGLVTDLELMQNAVKFSNFNLNVKELGSLMAFANKRAQETGESVTYLTNSIVDGLGRKSIKILDNLQIDVAKFSARVKESGDWAGELAKIIDEDVVNSTDLAVSGAARLKVAWQNVTTNASRSVGVWDRIAGSFADFLEPKNTARDKQVADLRNLGKQFGQIDAKNFIGKLVEFRDKEWALTNKIYLLQKQINSDPGNITNKARLQETVFILTEYKNEMVETAAAAKLLAERLQKIVELPGKQAPSIPNPTGIGGTGAEGLIFKAPMFINDLKEITEGMETISNLAGDIAANFVGALINGENFGESMINMLKQLAIQLAATAAIAGVLAALTGGGSAGFSGIFKGLLGFGGGGGLNKTTVTGQDINIVGKRNDVFLSRTSGG